MPQPKLRNGDIDYSNLSEGDLILLDQICNRLHSHFTKEMIKMIEELFSPEE